MHCEPNSLIQPHPLNVDLGKYQYFVLRKTIDNVCFIDNNMKAMENPSVILYCMQLKQNYFFPECSRIPIQDCRIKQPITKNIQQDAEIPFYDNFPGSSN